MKALKLHKNGKGGFFSPDGRWTVTPWGRAWIVADLDPGGEKRGGHFPTLRDARAYITRTMIKETL